MKTLILLIIIWSMYVISAVVWFEAHASDLDEESIFIKERIYP